MGQPCRSSLDYIRQHRSLAVQSDSRLDIPRGCAHWHLWNPQVSRLPSTLLPLQKMHVWHGQISRIVLWETQPQRLQRNLRLSRSHLLLRFAWSFPAAILLVSTVQAFTILKAAVLVCLLLISAYSALTWRTTHKP